MKKLFVAIVCAVVLAIVLVTEPAFAATLTVCETGCDHTTIQAAVNAANPDDVIEVQLEGEHTEANITIAKNLLIKGLGADVTVVQAAENICDVEGRVFDISGGAVVFEDMTIRHGCVSDTFTGGHAGEGGGIWSSAALLELRRTYITTNTVKSAGTGTVSGAGIYSIGSLRMMDSTVAGNEARSNGSAVGGGLNNIGTAVAANSTFSANFASDTGGGIHNAGTIGLFNVTVANNGASGGGDGLNNAKELSIGNSLLVNNNPAIVSSQDCTTGGAATIRDLGFNLVTTGNCGLPVVRKPDVGDLAFNGGPTPTHALLAGSPAIDAGDCTDNMLLTDQRAVTRPQGPRCDIGAVERPILHFPLIFFDPVPNLPDLVPIQLNVEPSTGLALDSDVVLSVVFQNQGSVSTPDNFWVDLYINPLRPPEVAGEIWCTLCPTPPPSPDECADDLGMAWHVTGKSLTPGQTMTLTSRLDPYLVPSQTHWNGRFIRSGDQVLYTYVDSWGGEGVPHGWIVELSEANNRLGPVRVDVSGEGVVAAELPEFKPVPQRGYLEE